MWTNNNMEEGDLMVAVPHVGPYDSDAADCRRRSGSRSVRPVYTWQCGWMPTLLFNLRSYFTTANEGTNEPETHELAFSNSLDRGYEMLFLKRFATLFTVAGIPRNILGQAWTNAYNKNEPRSSSYRYSIYHEDKQLTSTMYCGLDKVPEIAPGWPPDLDRVNLVGLPHDYGGEIKMKDGTLITGIGKESYWHTFYGFNPPYSTDVTTDDGMVDVIKSIPRPSFPQPSHLQGRLYFDKQSGILCESEETFNEAETKLIDYFSEGENILVEGVSSQDWDREHSCLVPSHERPRLSWEGDSARVIYEEWPAHVEYPTQETGQSVGHMGGGDTTQLPLHGRTTPTLSVLSTPAVQRSEDQPLGNRGATRQPVEPAYVREGLLARASSILGESLNPVVAHVHQADWAPNVEFKITTVVKQDGDLIVQEEKAVTDPADRDRYPEAFVGPSLLKHVKKHARTYAALVSCSAKELVQRIDDVMQSFPRGGTLPPTTEKVSVTLQMSSRFLESVGAGLSRNNETELCQKVLDGVERMYQLA